MPKDTWGLSVRVSGSLASEAHSYSLILSLWDSFVCVCVCVYVCMCVCVCVCVCVYIYIYIKLNCKSIKKNDTKWIVYWLSLEISCIAYLRNRLYLPAHQNQSTHLHLREISLELIKKTQKRKKEFNFEMWDYDQHLKKT